MGLGKSSSTPERLDDGVMTVLEESSVSDIDFLAHGTTVIINALTERKGVPVALITTRGFRDVLEIGRANRPDLYNLRYRKPKPFVPRRLRFEVAERTTYLGKVLTPLDEDEVRAALASAVKRGAEAVAVCFLHSYANPNHERRAAEIARAEFPGVSVTTSHALTAEWREYDRTSTTVLDAYVKPIARNYLQALERRLADREIRQAALHAMQSNGGVTRFELASQAPINLIESGPVGGVIGASVVGDFLKERNMITLDIGGTTAKSSLVEDGRIRLADDYHIERSPTSAGYPVKVPVVDIVEIGAGGGSIAWLDPAGALRVGPRSAGASPGPASYGWGGTDPTVTDANLIAGRINPHYFLGGRIELDADRARAAFAPLAEALRSTIDETALGVIRLANASMIHLLKLVSVRRGRDPRDFAIVAFGGGGSMHATALARELQVPRVIVPVAPGHFSAWGMLVSDLRHDAVQTRWARADEAAPAELAAVWRRLQEEMARTFESETVGAEDVTFNRFVDMRYAGQEHTVTVPVPNGEIADGAWREVQSSFHELHEQLYTFRLNSPIECVNFRLTGLAAVRKPVPLTIEQTGDVDGALKEVRDVHFDELGRQPSRIYERALLGGSGLVNGPAVIEEPAASTVVFPDQLARIDRYGNLIVERVA